MTEKRLKVIILIGLAGIIGLICFLMILDSIKQLIQEFCIDTYRAKVEITPTQFGFPEYIPLEIQVEPNVLIKSWIIPSSKKNPLIILIPGYQGTRKTMLPFAQFLYQAGYSTFLYDPRGQGESGGDCICGNFLAQDLGTIISQLKTSGYQQFVLFGLSMGATGAIVAGAENNSDVLGVIADSGFANLREGLRKSPLCEAKILFDRPFLYFLLKYFGQIYLYNHFGRWVNPFRSTNALKVVDKVKNLFIIHAEDDLLIPVYNAKMLFEKAQKTPGIKKLWIVKDSAHCENFDRHKEEYINKVLQFLEEIQRA